MKATRQPALTIEDFEGARQKEWFTFKPAEWAISTHELHHPRWAAPEGARLSLEV